MHVCLYLQETKPQAVSVKLYSIYGGGVMINSWPLTKLSTYICTVSCILAIFPDHNDRKCQSVYPYPRVVFIVYIQNAHDLANSEYIMYIFLYKKTTYIWGRIC